MTNLRMLAGLEDITAGDLYIDGKHANELEPKQRGVTMVFQSYALYPHMSVFDNLAFGLGDLDKEEVRRRIESVSKDLQIDQYLSRKPTELSGGQCQRVALGRAMVRNAKIFLLDEPLSNLDAILRVQMRSELVKLHEEIGNTMIYVTHDQVEAMTMATRVVVLNRGKIQQVADPKTLYEHPSNQFVATFIGSPTMNIVDAVYDNGAIVFGEGYRLSLPSKLCQDHDSYLRQRVLGLASELAEQKGLLALEEQPNAVQPRIHIDHARAIEKLQKELDADNKAILSGRHSVKVGIRPESIVEADASKAGLSPLFSVKSDVVELLGSEYYVHFIFENQSFIARIPVLHNLRSGEKISLAFDVEKIHLFDCISQKSLI